MLQTFSLPKVGGLQPKRETVCEQAASVIYNIKFLAAIRRINFHTYQQTPGYPATYYTYYI